MVVALGRGAQVLVGDHRLQDALALVEHAGEGARPVARRRKPRLVLLGQRALLGIGVRHRHPLQRALCVQRGHRAPVGDGGDGQHGHPAQRLAQLERGGERRARLGEKAGAPLGRLGLGARGLGGLDGLAQPGLRLDALDALAELPAQRGHRLEQVLVHRQRKLLEEVDHARHLAAHQERKGEGGMQAGGGGHPRAGKAHLALHVRDPHRLARLPGVSGQPLAHRERALPRERLEGGGLEAGRVPAGHPAQPPVAQEPEGSQRPAQVLAEGAQRAQRRALDGVGAYEDGEHGALRGQPLLGDELPLQLDALAQVAQRGDDDLLAVLPHRRQGQLDVELDAVAAPGRNADRPAHDPAAVGLLVAAEPGLVQRLHAGRHQPRERHAQHLQLTPAQERGGSRVGVDDPAALVGGDDGVGEALEDGRGVPDRHHRIL